MSDTGLIDLVKRKQAMAESQTGSIEGGASVGYVPPSEFYTQFEALLDERYGSLA